jgi:hypothetical protein
MSATFEELICVSQRGAHREKENRMDPFNAFNIALPLLIALIVANRGFTVDADYIARWLRAAGVVLTGESRPVVRRYLAWSRRCRTAGGVVGFVAPAIYSEMSGGDPSSAGSRSLTLMLVGYLLGALIAELVMNPPWHPRRDRLTSGRLGDYLPAYVPNVQRGLAVASLMLAAIYGVAGPIPNANPTLPMVEVLAWGIGGAFLAAIIEAIQRGIVTRRQPRMTAGDPAVDDAIKASSLRLLSGAGVALLLNIVGGELMVVSGITGRPGPAGVTGWSLLVLGGLMVLSSIVVWLDVGKPNGFRVRRAEERATV